MSGQNGELCHHRDDFPFNEDLSSIFAERPDVGQTTTQDLLCLDPLPIPMMSFTDYLHGSSYYGSLSRAFDLSFSPTPDVFASGEEEKSVTDMVVETSNVIGNNMSGVGTPITPISSVSSSSTEAAGEEDSGRCIKDDLKPEEELQELPKRDDDRGDSSKKVSRPRKKGEKRQRESRFAFVTKSDVDHLEDGYRWRKYGQKAVKNSPYPRSYYRCTTQKCSVKKRVERSFQDPTVVITTYEGQHTHHSPANIRGGSHMVAPPPSMSTSFLRDPMMQQLHPLINNGQQREMNPSMYFTSLQQLNLPDYGLLQDIVPAFINNIQP